jgi:hypothetical protein
MPRKEPLVGQIRHTGPKCPFKGTVIILSPEVQVPSDVPAWGHEVAIRTLLPTTGDENPFTSLEAVWDRSGRFFLLDSEIGPVVR